MARSCLHQAASSGVSWWVGSIMHQTSSCPRHTMLCVVFWDCLCVASSRCHLYCRVLLPQAPLLLWVAPVVVIYGVSYSNLLRLTTALFECLFGCLVVWLLFVNSSRKLLCGVTPYCKWPVWRRPQPFEWPAVIVTCVFGAGLHERSVCFLYHIVSS